MDEKECNRILDDKWPVLKSLLPVKWFYEESPLRNWISHSNNPKYGSAITYLEEEFHAIHDRFPSSFEKWVGALAVKGVFWSKRFESMIIFLLLRAEIPVESIDSTIPGSKKELDIKILNQGELLYIECTSLRPDPEMSAKSFLNSLQRKMKQLVNCPGQKIVMVDGTFNEKVFEGNAIGFEEDLRKVLSMDKLHDISFVTLSKMDVFSPNRIVPAHTFSAPWGELTPLVKEMMEACQHNPTQLRVVHLESNEGRK